MLKSEFLLGYSEEGTMRYSAGDTMGYSVGDTMRLGAGQLANHEIAFQQQGISILLFSDLFFGFDVLSIR